MTWGSTSSYGPSPERIKDTDILHGVIVGVHGLSLLQRECEGDVGIHLPGIHYSLFGSVYTQV